jgi:hypothetical protein
LEGGTWEGERGRGRQIEVRQATTIAMSFRVVLLLGGGDEKNDGDSRASFEYDSLIMCRQKWSMPVEQNEPTHRAGWKVIVQQKGIVVWERGQAR